MEMRSCTMDTLNSIAPTKRLRWMKRKKCWGGYRGLRYVVCFIWIECLYAGHVWLVCAFDFSVALNGFMAGHKREKETYAERMLSFSLHIHGGGCWSTREVLLEVFWISMAWHDSGKNATRILSTTSWDEQAEAAITLSKESIFGVLWPSYCRSN